MLEAVAGIKNSRQDGGHQQNTKFEECRQDIPVMHDPSYGNSSAGHCVFPTLKQN